MTRKLVWLAALATLGSGLLACGGAAESNDGSNEDDATSRIAPGEFKLYDRPNVTPNASCDVHTFLQVAGGSASLENRLGGTCELFVAPNPRSYKLRRTGGSCGSSIYTGKSGGMTLTVTDHRSRVCEDVVAARIIVEEKSAAGSQVLYSLDRAAPLPSAPFTVEGALFASMGIGGENTGFSLRSDSGDVYELILDAAERSDFVDAARAKVTGTEKLLSGVETRDRKAIDVTKLLACPARPLHINCMPPVSPGSLCASDDGNWLQANCPNVMVTH